MCQFDITSFHFIVGFVYFMLFSLVIFVEIFNVWIWGIFKNPILHRSVFNYIKVINV